MTFYTDSDMARWRKLAGDCPKCGRPKSVFTVTKMGPNTGRPFCKCFNCNSGFQWLDSPTTQPYYQPRRTPTSGEADHPKTNPSNSRTLEGGSVSPGVGASAAVASPVATKAGPLAFLSSQPAKVSLPVDAEPEAPSVTFVPSKYQVAIFDFLKDGSGNGVVIATAGSGKTTTLKQASPYLPTRARIAAIAFNRRNALDLQRVMPENVRASTFHSLGLSNLKKHNPQVRVDEDKVWSILRTLERDGGPRAEVVSSDGAAIRQVVSLAKSTLTPADAAHLEALCERYGVALNGNIEAAIDITLEVLRRSDDDRATADFGDMLYWCARGEVPCQQFDFVLQDEAQDATQAQIEFIKHSLRPGARLLSTGDPRQSLYLFAGSALNAMDQIAEYHHATTLPLSITYRCPLSHVAHLNARFPGLGMEARDGAPEGVIAAKSYSDMVRELSNGDLVVCRTNAPLVNPCFELIRQGRKATIAGRDIGKGLTVLLAKMEKRNRGASLRQLLTALQGYAENEIGKLTRARKLNQAATLQDQVDTVLALSDGCLTVGDVRRKVEAVFSDEVGQGVLFSSIHKSKGGQADNVYLYLPSQLPHPMAKDNPEQLAAEANVEFVAKSRSKHGLYLVEKES